MPNHKFKIKTQHCSNCCGCLVKIEHREIVPSLFHINDSLDIKLDNNTLMTTREWRHLRSTILRRRRIDSKRKKLPLDNDNIFYTEAQNDPDTVYEKYYLSITDN